MSEDALDNDEEKYLTKLRTDLRDFVQKKTQAAQAFEFAEQYHLATETADGSSHKAAAQHEHFPKDEVIRQIWLTAALSAEETRFQEGSSGVKQDSIQQLQIGHRAHQDSGRRNRPAGKRIARSRLGMQGERTILSCRPR